MKMMYCPKCRATVGDKGVCQYRGGLGPQCRVCDSEVIIVHLPKGHGACICETLLRIPCPVHALPAPAPRAVTGEGDDEPPLTPEQEDRAKKVCAELQAEFDALPKDEQSRRFERLLDTLFTPANPPTPQAGEVDVTRLGWDKNAWGADCLRPKPDGPWVMYTDHLAHIRTLESQLTEAKAQRDHEHTQMLLKHHRAEAAESQLAAARKERDEARKQYASLHPLVISYYNYVGTNYPTNQAGVHNFNDLPATMRTIIESQLADAFARIAVAKGDCERLRMAILDNPKLSGEALTRALWSEEQIDQMVKGTALSPAPSQEKKVSEPDHPRCGDCGMYKGECECN